MLAIVLIHRIGLILTVVSATVLLILPQFLTEEDDLDFLSKITSIMQYIVWSGLTVMVISGMLRLQFVYPKLLPLKLVFAGTLLLWSGLGHQFVVQRSFQRIQLALILITALTGLII